jgi:hypothetical protein
MKPRDLLVVALIVVSFLSISGCSPLSSSTASSASKGTAVDALNLTITSGKNVYQSSEVVSVTLEIKNVSPKNVRMNDRLAVHLPWSPASLWDVTFQVENESGQDISTSIRINKRLPGPKSYVVVAPRDVVEHTFSLYGLYPSLKPGKYIVWAIYKNQMESGDPIDVWQGEIKSNPISITIQ